MLDGFTWFFLVPFAVQVYLWLTERGWAACRPVGKIEECVSDPADVRLSRMLFYVLTLVYVLVYSRLVSRRFTFGQRVSGTMVVDAVTDDRIGYGRAVLRTVALIASALCLGLGFAWALVDRNGRTWHDLASRTRVVSI